MACGVECCISMVFYLVGMRLGMLGGDADLAFIKKARTTLCLVYYFVLQTAGIACWSDCCSLPACSLPYWSRMLLPGLAHVALCWTNWCLLSHFPVLEGRFSSHFE
ncbi:hypothetical protein Nepgr_033679 [Nepenthes gracilis]|uniref:Uncharacterized protein n=1 Tax=Nepenthes gracilis TaxID=150966 RepID=A0AAD3TKV7_NEPGR|nr:hypothetical protein Nepgr_033679 [Nepenthes gracilis]